MPKKIRVTVTSVIEYEPNPENYPGCNTIEEMAEFDRKAYDEDPQMIELADPTTVVKAEVVE
jgi:hypothetical protein